MVQMVWGLLVVFWRTLHDDRIGPEQKLKQELPEKEPRITCF